MSNSLYIYTSKNNAKIFTAIEKNTVLDDVVQYVTDYYTTVRTDTPVALNFDETDTLMNFILISITTHGVYENNLLNKINRRNVLFVTNFNDSEWSSFRLTDKNSTKVNAMKPNLNLYWTPIIDQVMNGECAVNFTSAFQDGDQSIVKYMHGRFGVPAVTCNKKYELGMTDWTIDMPTEKYDTVILSGIPNPSGQVHNIEDIKATFAPYCTDDFILIDNYEPEQTKLDVLRLWPNASPEELRRIGSERPQRIEGDKLNFVEEYRSINSYSLFSEELDEASSKFNRNSDILFEYFVDIY